MSFPICEVAANEFPSLLREIPQVPESLNYRGILPSSDMKLLAVVGSRNYSNYGKQVVEHLIAGLSPFNVGIVSGLALGIDSLAHKAALLNNMYTLAVPGSGIDDKVIYPAAHKSLAREILHAGGGLLSEFEPMFTATKWSFTQRNRIMAGMSHATLLIEAAEQSGTLITARMATDYNRELLVVPGDIFSANSKGVHQFLKLGATPVTNSEDILYALGIDHIDGQRKTLAFGAHKNLTPSEKTIIEALTDPLDTDALIRVTGLPTREANILLMQMEMNGLVTSSQGLYRAIV